MKALLRKATVAILLTGILVLPAGCGTPGGYTPGAAAFTPAPAATAQPTAMPGGATATQTAQPERTYDPDAQAAMGGFTLTVFTDVNAEKDLLIPTMNYLSESLLEKGWNVGFTVRAASADGAESDMDKADKIAREMASGSVTDGYIVEPSVAEALLHRGLTQNLSLILPSAAPVLYSRLRATFERSAAGLPTNMTYQNGAYPSALILMEQVAQERKPAIHGVADVLRFAASLEDQTIFAYPIMLIDAWAAENGYYHLGGSAFAGYLFAAYNDERCTPVPMERIPGFERFFREIAGLYAKGRFAGDDQTYFHIGIDDNVVGYVSRLFKQDYAGGGRRTVAYPFGVVSPDLPTDTPDVSQELAVSAGSNNAESIVRFVEWLFTDATGYLAVAYGREEVDYRMEDGRLCELAGTGSNPYGSAYVRWFFHCDALDPITVSAPVNYAEAVKEYEVRVQPIVRIVANPTARKELREISQTMFERVEPHITMLNQFFLNIRSAEAPDTACDGYFNRLSSMEEETNELVRAYSEVIDRLLMEKPT